MNQLHSQLITLRRMHSTKDITRNFLRKRKSSEEGFEEASICARYFASNILGFLQITEQPIQHELDGVNLGQYAIKKVAVGKGNLNSYDADILL
jgi:hypothetical protein